MKPGWQIDHLNAHMDSQVEMVQGKSVDFNNKELFGDLTLGVIARCAFALDTNAHQKHGDNVFVHHCNQQCFTFNKLLSMLPDRVKVWLQLSTAARACLDFLMSTRRAQC